MIESELTDLEGNMALKMLQENFDQGKITLN